MKRRFSAVILALCLTLTLLPVRGLAAESTEYWVEMSAAEARTMLTAVANKSESRYIVFVCYDAATQANPVESQFRRYANEKGYYIYGYHTGGGDLTDVLAPLLEGNTAPTLPVAVTWNPSTRTCMAKDNVRTMIETPAVEFAGLLTLMEANGLEHGSSAPSAPSDPDTPGTDPSDPDNPGTDPSEPDNPGTNPPSGGSSIAGVSEQGWEVLRLLNIYRMSLGLQPLSTFAEVQEAANIRAKELFLYCSHTRPDGRDYSTVFPEVGLPLSRSITSWAENIASGHKDAADVMDGWKRSPGHNANMTKVSGRVHIGIGWDYQTNGIPSLYASNWVQNFVAAYDCSFTNLRLSQSVIAGKPGTELESLLKEAGIEVTADCYRHGKSSLPLVAAMCEGYDPDNTDTQELTVTYGGQTATLTITGGDHVHQWDGGSVTEPASCTSPGRKTYSCTGCGAVKTETVPAAGHRFTQEADGLYSCEDCDAAVPAGWKPVYEALTANTEENKLFYPHGVEEMDTGAAESTVERYLTEQAAQIAQNAGAEDCRLDILDGQFTAGRTGYEYRIGLGEMETPEVFSSRSSEQSGYVLVTEPLVLLLNYAPEDKTDSKEETDVVTPEGNVSQGEAPGTSPSEPDTPSEPSRPSGGSSSSSSSSSTYSISAPQTEGGRVVLKPASASQGRRVTVTVQPDSGYVLASLEVTDAKGNEVELRDLGSGTHEFTMPASRVTVTAVFEKIPEEPALNPAPMPFVDVPSDSWFYSSVDYVWKHYLMSGVSATHFSPSSKTSRAMVWTILARLQGVPANTSPAAAWYENARQWAVNQGVSDGTAPDGDVTREQLAVMLWRAAGSPSAAAELSGFGDSGLISGYAQDAMRWAVEQGIMRGADGMLNPQHTASRAEVAVMLTQYVEKMG